MLPSCADQIVACTRTTACLGLLLAWLRGGMVVYVQVYNLLRLFSQLFECLLVEL